MTVIVPVYNEPGDIRRAIEKISSTLNGTDYEIIIAEDGSDDASGIVKGMKAKRVRVLHSKERLGRGTAINRAIAEAKSDIVVCMDIDLSSDISKTRRLIEGIENGAAISTGSRLMGGSRTKRSRKREILSRGYNFLVRQFLGSKVIDHQCGFKAFRKSAILPLLDTVKDKHWFWDTELLVRAQRAGLAVDEFPIEWKEEGGSKVRVLKDTMAMALGIVRLAVLDR